MGPRSVIDVGVAGRGLDGGISGDLAVTVDALGGRLIVAIDGLGHGPAAAEASATAARVLSARPEDPLEDLFERCHAALSKTRGAVMTAARIDGAGGMEWAGVGNVEGRLLRAAAGLRATESPVLFGGVLGHQSRRVRTSRVALERGDVLLLATDGVRADFSTGASLMGNAQVIAERVLRTSARGTDDALVVAARWLGPDP
jgi:hypothetical protein